MHGHVVMLMHGHVVTILHPHNTCVWGEIPRGLGMIVVTFKPSSEAC